MIGIVIWAGGSAWESNPPKTLLMPPDGVEVREAHRDSSAPEFMNRVSIHYWLGTRNNILIWVVLGF